MSESRGENAGGSTAMYYDNKVESLRRIFGAAHVLLDADSLTVDGRRYPIIDDVVILTPPSQHTAYVRRRLGEETAGGRLRPRDFAEDVQFSFGEEWREYSAILPEHRGEFERYFDLVDLAKLSEARVCDLGCGMGRWSYFVKDLCREVVLVDFSDAIFAARRNLAGADSSLFFMADLANLPFAADFADFIFCLGVLHHLPTPCLDAVRALRRYAPTLLVFLYYSLDNRPFHFRLLLAGVTLLRRAVCRIRSAAFRKAFALLGTWLIYLPLVGLGRLLAPLGLGSLVPLYDFYRDKGVRRIEQDVYDRFFTRIEQRVSRKQILTLRDSFSVVTVSEQLPYWHFLCRR